MYKETDQATGKLITSKDRLEKIHQFQLEDKTINKQQNQKIRWSLVAKIGLSCSMIFIVVDMGYYLYHNPSPILPEEASPITPNFDYTCLSNQPGQQVIHVEVINTKEIFGNHLGSLEAYDDAGNLLGGRDYNPYTPETNRNLTWSFGITGKVVVENGPLSLTNPHQYQNLGSLEVHPENC